jgi:uncharacterized membrane protein YhiD involved in acid resistance
MNIQNLLNSLLVSEQNSISLIDIFVTLTTPFLLVFFIALFYKKTTKSSGYNPDFVYSLFLFSSMVAIITLLIGSNIARAFGLVGALSLIRFRTAVKSPLDAIYLFWALGVGMACGTGFYFAAFMITFLGCTYLSLLYFFKFAESDDIGGLLKITVSKDVDDLEAIELKISKNLKRIKKVNSLFNSNDKFVVHIYTFDLFKNTSIKELQTKVDSIDEIKKSEFLNAESSLFL